MTGAQLLGWFLFFSGVGYAALKAAPASASSGGGDVVNGVTATAGGADGSDLDTLARTLYGEARGEIGAAVQGVASVIITRANMGPIYGYPASVAGVCKQRNQFDCWNVNDVNLSKILAATMADPAFARCWDIASQAMSGALPDDTGGAEFYHDTSIAEPASWQRAGYVRTVQIDHLIFYRRG